MTSILLAEDDFIQAHCVMDVIKKSNAMVLDWITNFTALLEYTNYSKVDMVLLNVKLSDGKLNTRILDEIREQSEVPIVVLTGYMEDQIDPGFLKTKNCHFIPKPYPPFSLYGLISEL